jgi:periplasmic divalent cation tolerance protein
MIRKNKLNYCLVLVTAPEGPSGPALARALVEEGLAACVNLVPGLRSIYRDQGAVQEAAEVLLMIKTRADLYSTLEARVHALHPYRVPEVIAVPVSGGAASYLKWLDEAVAGTAG